jgi:hypothetical protein
MIVRWITQREANDFVIRHHRHHSKVVGSIFQLGLFVGGELQATSIVARPVARRIDFRAVCELTRLCSNGYENACSKLYGSSARIAKEMGFQRIITYILASESGASLKAAGWTIENESAGGGEWSKPSRPRELQSVDLFGTVTKYPIEMKVRWGKKLNDS